MHIACIVFMYMHKYIQRQLIESGFIVGMTMVSNLTPSAYIANIPGIANVLSPSNC